MDEIRSYWNAEAATFDDEPDHGLGDPATRAAWRGLLREQLPAAPVRVADMGCGTGTLSLLLAEEGYDVTGVDLAPAMVERARAKTGRLPARFLVGDAAQPGLPARSFEVVLSRHVLWALPDPQAALHRWAELLSPDGRLVLIEGRWFTGGGLAAKAVTDMLARMGRACVVRHLAEPVYWGREIEDERYLVLSTS